MDAMQTTMLRLCENTQGCVFGYTQSDEITLILVDYAALETSAWFDNEVQKMCSVSSSMATLYFNRAFARNVQTFMNDVNNADPSKRRSAVEQYVPAMYDMSDVMALFSVYARAVDTGAMFDARVFNVPKEEVCNLLYWRQLDAVRNSVQMAGHAYFSQSELKGKNSAAIQDMLLTQYGVRWSRYPADCKRGAACLKTDSGWTIDDDMPLLKGADREYVEKFVFVGE